VSSRTARATQRNPVSKNKQTKTKQKQKNKTKTKQTKQNKKGPLSLQSLRLVWDTTL
jgi:predicted nuclease of restriction endonuclease-like (RecB) superfamily